MQKRSQYLFTGMLPLLLSLIAAPLIHAQLTPSVTFTPAPTTSGAVASSSSSVPNGQWANLLGDALWFYEAQRSGTLPSSNRVSWRNTSCTDDGSDAGLDLAGGYYDAGDYIKNTFSLSSSLASISWGAIDLAGEGYNLANQTAYLDAMLRWGYDWMIKAHPSADVLYVQIGNGTLDNAYWGGDLTIPTPRPSSQINSSHPGTDAAAAASAAFSAASLLYSGFQFNSSSSSSQPASLSNATYASTLLSHATDLFNFAVNASPMQTYQTAAPLAADTYASSSFGDDLCWSALWIALASNSSSFFAQAVSYYNTFNLINSDAVFNWDSMTPALPILFTQAIISRPGIAGSNSTALLAQFRQQSERYFDRIISGSSPGYLTKGGLLWYDGDSDDASLNPALNSAMLMLRYSSWTLNTTKASSYIAFAQNQINYALGQNPMNVPYIVGVNPNSPTNPSSAMASGGDNVTAVNTDPPVEAYVLYGAVVGGPDSSDNFFNIRADWPQTEVALDYNAPLLTLAAMAVAQDASDPYYTRLQAGAYTVPSGSPCDSAYPCSSPRKGLSLGAKIAIGILVPVAVLSIFAAGLFFWACRGPRSKFRW